METKSIVITKLNGHNYFLWKIKMQMLLQKEKLWKIVQENPPTANLDEWQLKDESARATIGLAIEDSVLIIIMNCVTAKQTWLKLQRTYEHANLSNKIYLMRKLFGTKYEMFKNMEEYINGVKELSERLRNLGEVVKDSNLVAVLLCGLPSSFDALITTIEARPDSDLTVDFVTTKLRDEASRKEGQYPMGEQTESAMATSENRLVGMRRGRITCYNCGNEGHVRRNCTRRAMLENNREQNGKAREGYTAHEESQHRQSRSGESENEEVIRLTQQWAMSGEHEEQTSTGQTWVVDSGASAHMSNNREEFLEYESLSSSVNIKLANGEYIQAEGEGDIKLKYISENKVEEIKLKKVLYVPTLHTKLISVKALCREDYKVIFDKQNCIIMKNGKSIIHVKGNTNVFIVNSVSGEKTHQAATACIHVWHRRLGHRGMENIRSMAVRGEVEKLEISKCNHKDFCRTCQKSKMTRRPFESSTNGAKGPFKVLVTDLCGPIDPLTMGGKRYIFTLTDEYSGYVQIELLRNKNEATVCIQEAINKGFNKFGFNPEVLRSDGGGEFCNRELDAYLTKKGIEHQIIVSHNPEQNGKAERVNRTLLETMRALIKQHNLPLSLWGEAACTAAYLHNRTSTAKRKGTPYEFWNNRLPRIDHLRTVGCIAYVHVPKKNRKKLEDTGIKGYLVGYGIGCKGYRIWIPGTRKIINATTVVFDENSGPLETENHKQEETDEMIQFQLNDVEEPLNGDDTMLRRSSRSNKGRPADRLSL